MYIQLGRYNIIICSAQTMAVWRIIVCLGLCSVIAQCQLLNNGFNNGFGTIDPNLLTNSAQLQAAQAAGQVFPAGQSASNSLFNSAQANTALNNANQAFATASQQAVQAQITADQTRKPPGSATRCRGGCQLRHCPGGCPPGH